MQAQSHTEEELIAFMEKLADFHETLDPKEQALMDHLTASALSGGNDVEGFLQAGPNLQTLYTTPSLQPAARPYYRQVAGLIGGVQGPLGG